MEEFLEFLILNSWKGFLLALIPLVATIVKIYFDWLQIRELRNKLRAQEEIQKNLSGNLDDEPFKALSSVHHFDYSRAEGESKLRVKIFRVFSILVMKDGDYTIKTYRYSSGKIISMLENDMLDDAQCFGCDAQSGRVEINLRNAKKGDKKLYCITGEQENNLGARQTINDQGDIINNALKDYLTTDRHDFAGTRFYFPVDSTRFMITYPEGLLPEEVSVVVMDVAGAAVKADYMKKKVKSRNLWVVEINNINKNYCVYVYWYWPKQRKSEL